MSGHSIDLQSRAAIEQIVRRHGGWIHAVATRRVRDTQLAEDVTQAVFIVLSQKPPRLSSEPALAAWLLRVACHISSNAIRAEVRRKRRERGYAMQHREAVEDNAEQQWQEISPHLDQAVLALSDEDRQAVLLRFYQQKSHVEVAQALGISNDAARKRVSRAVDKLRAMLSRKGATVPSAAVLLPLLESHVTPSAFVASAAASVNASALAKGAIVMLSLHNAKLVVLACAASLLLTGGAVVVVMQLAAPPPATKSTATEVWRQRFDQVYFLEDGQVLKLIATPFIPERANYFRQINPEMARAMPRGPDYMSFYWNGRLQNHGMSFGNTPDRPIKDLLNYMAGLQTFEFDGPVDLLSFRLKGDWIIREGATREQRLAAFCRIVRENGGPAMQFRQQAVPQQVVVAAGQFDFHPLGGFDEKQGVQITAAATPSKNRMGNGNGSLEAFIATLEADLGMRIIDQVAEPRPKEIPWTRDRSMGDLATMPPGPQRDEKLRQVLDLLWQQTGLQFTFEQHNVKVWMAEKTTQP